MVLISGRELKRLKASVDELSALNRIAAAINLSNSLDEITDLILDSCLKRLKAEQGAVFLMRDQESDRVTFETFIREKADAAEAPYHLNQSIIGWMIKHKQILLINDLQNDDRLKGIDFDGTNLSSILSVPLISQNGLIGIMVLFNKRGPKGFTESDKRFLGIVGTQSAKLIENAQLFQEQQKLKVMEEEMSLARSIQERYLPRDFLSHDSYEVRGYNCPARQIGGDYFQMNSLDEGRVFLSVGDVSGKGVPAALMAAEALAVIRSLLHTNSSMPLDELTSTLNRLFFESTAPGQFMTALFATFDAESRQFSYVNAGHIPPFVIKKSGQVMSPEGSDIVIGVLQQDPFNVFKVHLEPGDSVVFCTDGVTECLDKNDKEFGIERFVEFLSDAHGESPDQIIERAKQSLCCHRNGHVQTDDVTMLVMQVK